MKIICEQKINDCDFLKITEEKLYRYGIPGGSAARLVNFAKECEKKKLRIYISLSEVLAEYGIESDGIDSIPFFTFQTQEIEDDNKLFRYCMFEILS